MKKITRRSFLAAMGTSAAALALTASRRRLRQHCSIYCIRLCCIGQRSKAQRQHYLYHLGQ